MASIPRAPAVAAMASCLLVAASACSQPLPVIVQGAGGNTAVADAANHLARIPLNVCNGASTGRWGVVSARDQETADGDSVPGIDPVLTLPNALRSAESWNRYVAALATLDANPVVARIVYAVTARH